MCGIGIHQTNLLLSVLYEGEELTIGKEKLKFVLDSIVGQLTMVVLVTLG